jgi:ketosteroid isomerase-like protein
MPGHLTPEDIEYIRDGYRLFAEGDPAFFERYDPDATMVFAESLPGGGTYRSPFDALEFWASMSEAFEDVHPEPSEFLLDGDRLVVLGYLRGRSRATGNQVTFRLAHVFRLTGGERPLREQKITSFEVLTDTAAVLAARGTR